MKSTVDEELTRFLETLLLEERREGERDYYADVADERHKGAELALMTKLRREGWKVRDNRAAKTAVDFFVTQPGMPERSLDVKHDSYFDKYSRVPYEAFHRYEDGRELNGWGRSRLDLLGIIGTSLTACHIYSVRLFREYVELHEGDPDKTKNWRRIERANRKRLWGGRYERYVTNGWAVPHRELVSARVHRLSIPLPVGGVQLELGS